MPNVMAEETQDPMDAHTDEGRRSGVPVGKRVLNTHIALEEHTFLKSMANKNSMTVTMFLRNLIRREMQRNRDVDLRYGT